VIDIDIDTYYDKVSPQKWNHEWKWANESCCTRKTL